ncbi:hypothetical protein Psch_00248 [Pelotomaculum schinkii]|uniref:Uncharacterized protein n=1 Tax=Pelotomaculum schinkii TaxID=78350 RepID=A0A4Y7RD20_9FIRM|nr:hypothetical protein [Pelotomaculum schinkii]TEB06716.1 hypothetical protein Psch_00248 [Pelotomaculum schinkii]
MVTSRVDINRIKDGKGLLYLDEWYCPLEAARTGMENLPGKPNRDVAIPQFTPTLMRKNPHIKKHLMAGF